LGNLREALKSDEGDRIKKTMENLSQVSQKLAEEMYKSAAPAGGSASGEPGSGTSDRATAGDAAGKKDEDVIDAEYEVKKD